MRVKIFGPNLSGPAQQKGQLHVHAAECGDCKHYGPGRKFDGEDGGWEIDAETYEDCGDAVYSDHIAEGSMTIEHAVADLYYAPCTKALTHA